MIYTTGWKLTGTKSFRLASSKLLGEFGGNMQNNDSTLLRCMRPTRPGYKFISADQAGAEALIVANEAPRGRFIELFEVGIKPHTYLALHIFLEKFRGSYPVERYWCVSPRILSELPEWPTLNSFIADDPANEKEYKLGKTVIHASNYDMKWKTFQTNVLVMSQGSIILTPAEAKRFLEVHATVFPEIKAWQGDIRARLEATRTLRNLFGHPRVFNGRMNEDTYRDGYSWIPQSTVGEITNNACVATQDHIETNRLAWDFVNNKHDSITVCAHESEELDAARWLKSSLEVDLRSTTGVRYKMKAEVSIGTNMDKWSKDNLNGLKKIKL